MPDIMEYAFNPPEYLLTKKYQFSKECKDGKQRNFLLYFLNGNLILKQKVPYDEHIDKGFDRRTAIYDECIFNGRLYQTRTADVWCGTAKTGKTRKVSFPLSRARLLKLGVPEDHRIEIL
jgi:hypothetical protein